MPGIKRRSKVIILPDEKEKMIPLSVVDAFIQDLNNWFETADVYEDSVSNMVSDGILRLELTKETIKKKAILVQPLEQKIKDRIKELEEINFNNDNEYNKIRFARDELRKLLE